MPISPTDLIRIRKRLADGMYTVEGPAYVSGIEPTKNLAELQTSINKALQEQRQRELQCR